MIGVGGLVAAAGIEESFGILCFLMYLSILSRSSKFVEFITLSSSQQIVYN
jgi:hypothetical protein